MDTRRSRPLLLLLTSMLVLIACERDEESNEEHAGDYDRSVFLEGLANGIDEDYTEYITALLVMESSFDEFHQSPNPQTLSALRQSWSQALLSWQSVAVYDFGLAEDLALLASSNTYPISVNEIEEKIANGDTDLNGASDLDATGLQALDYLFHGDQVDDQTILAQFHDGEAESLQRRNYVEAVLAQLRANAEAVAATWSANAPERAEFVENDGTSEVSSISVFLNAFNRTYERNCRTAKLGIPAGALTFSGQPNPQTVEALYERDNSIAYLLASIEAYEKIYLGPEDGQGLEEYLQFLDARYNGEALDDVIKNQFQGLRTEVDRLQDPMTEFVEDDQSTALEVYASLQELVTLFKVDMMSSLGVLITYEDTDGD